LRLLRSRTGASPLATQCGHILFPEAHHFVTERPSVAQNPAQVTAILLAQKSPEKFHPHQNP
jgi:hypothetical protein